MNKTKFPTPSETIEEREQTRRQKAFIIKNSKILIKNLNKKNLLLLWAVPTWGYFLSLDCVTNKRKALNAWRTLVELPIIQEPIYDADDRDVNIMYDLETNSFQGIVQKWYARISSNTRSLISLDVKRNLLINIGVWTFRKYLIGHFFR